MHTHTHTQTHNICTHIFTNTPHTHTPRFHSVNFVIVCVQYLDSSYTREIPHLMGWWKRLEKTEGFNEVHIALAWDGSDEPYIRYNQSRGDIMSTPCNIPIQNRMPATILVSCVPHCYLPKSQTSMSTLHCLFSKILVHN